MRHKALLLQAVALTALVLPQVCRGDYSNTVMSLNPVAYWPLNETNQPPPPPLVVTNYGTMGSSGNGSIAGPLFKVASALVADSDPAGDLSIASVRTPYAPKFTFTGSFSAEGWFKPSDNGFNCVLSCGHLDDPRTGWLIYDDGAAWNFRMYESNGLTATINIGGGDVTPGVWHHVAATWDGSTATVYVDGVSVATGTPSDLAPAPNNDGDLTVGMRSDGGFKWLGSADEVAVYTNLLSAADVLAHYQNGTNASPSTPYKSLILAKNPLVYFRLDEGLNGTVANFPLATNYGSLGSAVNGRYYPGTEPGQAGPTGTGFGANNYSAHFVPDRAAGVECGTDPGLDIATNAMSVVCWFKGGPTDHRNRFQSPLGRSDGSWRMDVDWLGIARFVAGSPDCVGTSYVNDTVWHFYAGVFDGAQQLVYVDGVLEGSVAGIGGSDPGARMRIGGVGDYEDRFFNGSVAQVAVFTNALSDTQIRSIFAAGAAPVTVLRQPEAVSSYVGLSATLSVYALGVVNYQWQKNGSPITGETNRTLTLSPLTLGDTADYRVALTGAAGTVFSSNAHLSVSATAPTSLNVSSNLVLHLKFNGNSLDTSGRGNHGTNVGAITYVADGIVAPTAVHYSTDSSASTFNYVTLGVRPDLEFSSNVNFTIAYWIRYPLGQNQAGDLPVFGNAVNSSYNPGYVFFQDSSHWGWTLHGSGGGDINIDNYGSGSPFADGNWHHVAIVAERSGYATTYFDGSGENRKPIAELANMDTTNNIVVGQDSTGSYGVTGSADVADLGAWRRLLSASEIASMFVGGMSNHISFISTPLPLTISRLTGNQIQLSWSVGVLQSATQVGGPYTDIPSATSPYTTTTSGAQVFYRVRE